MDFGQLQPKREAAQAYCPKCNVTCFYKPGNPHFTGCPEILVTLEERDKLLNKQNHGKKGSKK